MNATAKHDKDIVAVRPSTAKLGVAAGATACAAMAVVQQSAATPTQVRDRADILIHADEHTARLDQHRRAFADGKAEMVG